MGEKLRTFLVVAVAMILRCCVSYHPYSGQEKPPMYGDYEAQRHWQEITLNLPIERWYTNSSDNDLQYWGLDYPPLTAYHSLLLGHIARWLDPSYVELQKSRGYESQEHKYFMRLSVLAADLLIYVPAVLCFVRTASVAETPTGRPESSNIFGLKRRDFVLATALLYPGIILIDHGHFQYNCVSLGLFAAAVTAILRNSTIAASLLFSLALNYKQMELYHALPFFFYILGNNTPAKRKSLLSCVRALICVSLTVMITFIALWAPFLQKWSLFIDVATRLFPFARGVFEDKVANVWCAVNVLTKLRESFTNFQLARICLAATSAAVMPSCFDLYLRPVKEKFVVALVNSALGFFLFSFQVHEKSILLVAVPVVMYFHKDPFPCFWFLLMSSFSMLPLFAKDGLLMAFAALNAFYGIAVYLMWPQEFAAPAIRESSGRGKTRTHKGSSAAQRKAGSKQSGKSRSYDHRGTLERAYGKLKSLLGREFVTTRNAAFWPWVKFWVFCGSVVGAIILSVASVVFRPPENYPDLFPLLISVYSCGHFCVFFLYFNYKQIYVLHSTKAKPY